MTVNVAELASGRILGIYEIAEDRGHLRGEADELRARGFFAGLEPAEWAALIVFAASSRGDYLASGRELYLLSAEGAVFPLGDTLESLLAMLPRLAAERYDLGIDLGIPATIVRDVDAIERFVNQLARGQEGDLEAALSSEPLVLAYVSVLRALIGPRGDAIPDDARRDAIDTVVSLARRRAPALFDIAVPRALLSSAGFDDPTVRAWADAPSIFEGAISRPPSAPIVEPIDDALRPELDARWIAVDDELTRLRAGWSDALADTLLARCREAPLSQQFAVLRQIRDLDRTRDEDHGAREQRIAARLASVRAISWPFVALAQRVVHGAAARAIAPVLDGVDDPLVEPTLLQLIERPTIIPLPRGSGSLGTDVLVEIYLRNHPVTDEVADRFLRWNESMGHAPLAILGARVDLDRVFRKLVEWFELSPILIARALVNRPGRDTVASMKRLLKSRSNSTRIEAARVLIALGDPAGPEAYERAQRAAQKM